jgi:outer membrane protein assembly factor BamB
MVVEHQQTSKRIWAKSFDPAYDSGNLPITYNGPTIWEDILYLPTASGFLKAYALQDGRELWSISHHRPLVGTPLIFEDKIFYSSDDGRLIARRPLNGELLYEVDLGAGVESKAMGDQGKLFLHTRNHKVFCLEASSGKILWSYARTVTATPTLQGLSSPLSVGDHVIIGFADGFLVSLAKEDGKLQWETKLSFEQKFMDVDNTPMLYGKHILINAVGGDLHFVNHQTGQTTVKIPLPLSRSLVPIYPTDEHSDLLGITIDGRLIRMNPSGKIVKEKKLTSDGLLSHILWGDDWMVVSATGQFFTVDPENFDIKDSFALGHRYSTIFGQMTTTSSFLAFFTSRHRLYVYQRLP